VRERKPQAGTENGVQQLIAGSEAQTSLISLVVGGRFPTLLSGLKREYMNYVTKVRKVRAVRYNGQNKQEIKEFVASQLENFVYPLDNGNLLLRDGTVHIGDWVVLDGIAKILSHGQFMELYEEAS